MATKILKVDPVNPEEKYLKKAADIIKGGGVVIIPTETVYGIAADSSNDKTIQRLSAIKKRPKDKPFSLHIDSKEKLKEFTRDVPVAAYKLIDKFWPGPLTLILKSKDNGTIGIRMPDDKVALKIINKASVPVVCPSANIAGNTAPIDFTEAIKDLDGLVDLAIDAGRTRLGIESTVVDLTVQPLVVLREAAIKKEEIEDVISKKIVLFVCTGNSCRSVMAKGLLEKKLNEQGRSDVEVLSAGIMETEGLNASADTKEILTREGIDVSAHRSQRITVDMLHKSDMILVMDTMHEEHILKMEPQVKNRLFLLKEFARGDDNSLNIPDPIGRSRDFYEYTFSMIKEAIEKVSRII